ncbi:MULTISPECIES: ABC transporter permease [unclassified Marinovum]
MSLWRALSGEGTGLGHLWQTVLPAHLLTTIAVALGASVLAALIGALTAWCVSFYRLPLAKFIDVALVLPLLLPAYLVAMVYRETLHGVAWPNVETGAGLAVVLALTHYPYVYLLTRAALRRKAGILIEQAQALGVARRDVARRVLVPMALPSVALGALLVLVEAFSDFGTADALAVDTVTTVVRRVWFAGFQTVLALQVALMAAVIPVVAALLVWLMAGRHGFAIATNRPRRPPVRTLPFAAAALLAFACLIPSLLGFVVPVVIMTAKAAPAFADIRLDGVPGDIGNTLLVSSSAAGLALAVGLFSAWSVRQTAHGGWTSALAAGLALNLALPSIVIGFAALTVTGWISGSVTGRWISDTVILLTLALALRHAVVAHFSIDTALRAVPRRMDEAGRVVGRSQAHMLRRVLAPLASGGILAGALMVFVAAARDLTLSLTLQPFGFSSLSLSAFHLAKVDAHAEAAVYALCLALVLAYPVLSIHRWSRGAS